MFNKSRPVPSKAALRVLYQLAYISSGTAVGVAALCAEERRRRTHYVQKIADNARRLRQSPRHVHNVAAAKAADDESEQDRNFWEEQSREEHRGGSDIKSAMIQTDIEAGERLVRAPELPSVVERGYAQVTRDHKRVRRRGKLEETVRQSGVDGSVQKQRSSERAKRSTAYLPLFADRVEPKSQSFRKVDFASRDRPLGGALRIHQDKVSREGQCASRNNKSFREGRPPTLNKPLNRPKISSQPPVIDRFKIPPPHTHVVHPAPRFLLNEAAELVQAPPKSDHADEQIPLDNGQTDIGHDVDLFFSSLPWTSTALHLEGRVASCLLGETLRRGYLSAVRKLVSWKLANDQLDELDVTRIQEAFSDWDPDSKNESREVFEVFAELFQSSAFMKLPEDFRLTMAISSTADALSWDLDVPPWACAERLLQPVIQASRPDSVDRMVMMICTKYLDASQVRRAWNVIKAVRQSVIIAARQSPTKTTKPKDQTKLARSSGSALNQRWKAIYELVLEHAFEEGQLWVVARYVKLLIRAGDDPDRGIIIERFLQECCHRNMYGPVGKLITYLVSSGEWNNLTDQGRVAVAIAWRAEPTNAKMAKAFDELYRTIPLALRGPVVEALCANRMKVVWNSQRNLEAVWAEYNNVKSFQFEPFGPAEITLIEICNKANRADEALKLLSSSLRRESHNHLSLCVAAVSLARKSAWRQLRGLIDMIAKSGKFINDELTGRNLNDVIDIYSRRHTAYETWKFVTDMIETMGFAPNRITSDIMLQCFVVKKLPGLIPRWIRHLKTLGHDFQMNSKSAVKLLTHFYYDQRPPHVLLMWFSRNLEGKWPSVNTDDLRELVKQAIGYDLRKLNAQDKSWIREKAAQNLASLAVSQGAIPAPYAPAAKPDPKADVSRSEPSIRPDRAHEAVTSVPPLGQQYDLQSLSDKLSGQSELSGSDELPQTDQAVGDVDKSPPLMPQLDGINFQPLGQQYELQSWNDKPSGQSKLSGSDELPQTDQAVENVDKSPLLMPQPELKDVKVKNSSQPAVESADNLSQQDQVVDDVTSFQPLGPTQDLQDAGFEFDSQSNVSGIETLLQEAHPRHTEDPDIPTRISRDDIASTASSGGVSGAFAELRPQYDSTDHGSGDVDDENESGLDLPDLSTEEPDYTRESKRQQRLVNSMILALSLRDYSRVLHLYKESLTPNGLPALLGLEVALEASIRFHRGDLQEATEMMTAAREAGMDVRRAMGPLLIHQIYNLDSAGKKDANKLRTTVIDYYRTNQENGFPIHHHLGVTAANTLINNHLPEYGINILNSILRSEWSDRKPLDIVPMTVYIKGFARLHSQNGIVWVIHKVLSENMRIDRPFILALKDACRYFGVSQSPLVRRTRRRYESSFMRSLRVGRQKCIARRAEQRFETKKFGNLLVKTILACVEREKTPRRASKALNRMQAPKKETPAATTTEATTEEVAETKPVEETPAATGEAKATDAQPTIGDVETRGELEEASFGIRDLPSKWGMVDEVQKKENDGESAKPTNETADA